MSVTWEEREAQAEQERANDDEMSRFGALSALPTILTFVVLFWGAVGVWVWRMYR